MHIPDNYLSPSTCAVMTAAMVPVWTISVKKVKANLPKEKIVTLGTLSAFSFLGMMFNIPIPGGTTGHAVGATLIACLLGPYASCLAVSVALLIQALLFGDGGVLAFGANCFNMAFVMPFVAYFCYRFISSKLNKKTPSLTRDLISAGISGYLAINAAALCAAIEFGIQPLLFTDAAGNALYCPYPLSVSIPAMMIGHLTLFGLAEVIYTVFVLGFIRKTSPDISMVPSIASSNDADTSASSRHPFVGILVAILIVLTPLGLLATGTAWGEWGADEISSVVSNGSSLGYTPDKIANGFSLETLIPDYAIAGMPEWIAYILSAVIGTALLVIVFKIAGTFSKKKESIFNE